ncbi:MAG: flagellin FliC, partial [Bdellovibrionales bacterium]|nr:flagellin FliC [Bdellovibrionales bacterium]
LAVNSASDTVGDEERGFLEVEFQQLVSEFDRIAKSTRFGNKQLLTGSNEEFSFHVGPFRGDENIVEFTLDADTTSGEVGIQGLKISDQDDALDAMEDIDKAVLKVAGARSKLGAVQSRFQYLIDNLDVQRENLMEAHSLITDADVAEEVSRLTHSKILQESGLMALAQANQSATSVLRLVAI